MYKKDCEFQECRASAIYPNPTPSASLRGSPYKLLDRPHLNNTVDIQVTPLEMTILIASLIVFLLMFIWIIVLTIDISLQYVRGTLFNGGYHAIEGRRYRQDMMRGGDHLEHRMIRRSIVERLARFGMVDAHIALPQDPKTRDVEATAIARDILNFKAGCEGGCQTGVVTRRRSAEQ
ncbi:hypothetical protein PVAG01_01748 [Phlyctema vagabunda]|uniref:Uncharacterized protein n=1 Tax=Phlyctema vagabunda TaxID=108571 RepID=A0ABR4PXX9_9HELO